MGRMSLSLLFVILGLWLLALSSNPIGQAVSGEELLL